MPQMEAGLVGLLTGGRLPKGRERDAKAVYAQLLTIAATADDDVGDHLGAVRGGELAASVATEAGDNQTAGHAWSVVASALCNSGRGHAAISAAQRACAAAGSSPAAVMALVEQAATAAKTGRLDTVVDAVVAAEGRHARLPESAWGAPGYSFGTYHPANLKMFAGWSLAKVGKYREAVPRLDDAADLAAGTGLMVFVRLARAQAALGTGDADGAIELAATAVADAERRPAAWVAREVRHLDERSRGAFAELVGQTRRWGLPVGGARLS
jgi:hypothetical protein